MQFGRVVDASNPGDMKNSRFLDVEGNSFTAAVEEHQCTGCALYARKAYHHFHGGSSPQAQTTISAPRD